MTQVTVKAAVATLYATNDDNATQCGELLAGTMATLAAPPQNGRCLLRTEDGREGYAAESALATDENAAREWAALGKMLVRSPFVDVLAQPSHTARRLCTLPRGSLLHPLGAQNDGGWLPVQLPGGETGHAKSGNLMPHLTTWQGREPRVLREALATSALSYLGTQYRHGGSTPAGIDAPGLCAMAYRLNGIILPFGTTLQAAGPLREIPQAQVEMGDLIYFENHVAMVLGNDQYLHATGRDGSDGVVINSLLPTSPFYLDDLAGSIAACASLFAPA